MEYWELFFNLTEDDRNLGPVRFQVAKENGENFRPSSEEQTKEAIAKIGTNNFVVTSREDTDEKQTQSAFITSTLQQAAST